MIRAAAAGAATLVAELALIRYLPGQIRLLGYFSNLVLLACFLGFGSGMLLARRPLGRRFGPEAPALGLLLLVLLAALGRGLNIGSSLSEVIFLEYRFASRVVPLAPFLAASFAAIAAANLPLGALTGRSLAEREGLGAYAANLAGSLAGSLLFAAGSALAAPPWTWFLAAGALGGLAAPKAAGARRAGALAACAACAVLAARFSAGAVWSPYQKISTGPLRVTRELGLVQEWFLPSLNDSQRRDLRELPPSDGLTVRVNDDSYQTMVDLSDASIKRSPELANLRRQYDLPFLRKNPGREVLILGAGTGNDAAAALRAGASRVVAVEIDPVIVALGMGHPERPYSDPRTTVVADDARRFLARDRSHYDTIIFGLLDSHVLMSGKSPVRLDSFVFTRESFALARLRLKRGGALMVSHAVGSEWFSDRMRRTLTEAFGRPPVELSKTLYHPIGRAYATGATMPAGKPAPEGSMPNTDDWPFLYLNGRGVPSEYLFALLMMAALSLAFTRLSAGPGLKGLDAPAFFYGAGFMLLETRAVTALAPLFGSTWQVNSLVFGGVLLAALLATAAAAARGADRYRLHAAGLLALGLLVLRFLPLDRLASAPGGSWAALAAVAWPIACGGFLFSRRMSKTAPELRLASNLLGAMAGGMLEYSSLAFGLAALVPLAAALYFAGFRLERSTSHSARSGPSSSASRPS